jgi:quercetin dioxygenase-like cupin family protein
MFIAAGVALTGKIHKYAHWNVVLKGRIRIITEKGMKEIVAPAMFVSPPGTKRAGYALEDTEWVTIHPTEETDIETIEKQIAVDTYEELAALAVDGEVIK